MCHDDKQNQMMEASQISTIIGYEKIVLNNCIITNAYTSYPSTTCPYEYLVEEQDGQYYCFLNVFSATHFE